VKRFEVVLITVSGRRGVTESQLKPVSKYSVVQVSQKLGGGGKDRVANEISL